MRARLIVATVAALLSIPTRSAAQHVFVVAPTAGPGVFSTEIQPAVDVAADGDIVVVHAGAYATGVTITGKSLTLTAAAGDEMPLVSGQLRILGPSLAQRLVIRGVAFTAPYDSGPALHALSVAGTVWIEDCSFTGTMGSIWDPPDAAARIEDCEAIMLVRSRLTGYDKPCQLCAGATALVADNSTIFLLDAECTGGSVLVSNQTVGFPGYPGASLTGGFLFAAGSTFIGGDGGGSYPLDMCDPCTGTGGAGGAGLEATGAVTVLDCQFVAGTGGQGWPPEYSGPDGLPYIVEDLTFLPGAARGFTLSSPVEEGQLVTAAFDGLPGELVGVLYGALPSSGVLHPELSGALWIDSPSTFSGPVGTVRASGTLELSFRAPILPSVAQGIAIRAQSIHIGPGLAIAALGPPSSVVILDATP